MQALFGHAWGMQKVSSTAISADHLIMSQVL